jgi:hypothetical protein
MHSSGYAPTPPETLRLRGLQPVWLASYPRSGNTFLRILLERVFGMPTYSLYAVMGQEMHDPSAAALRRAPRLPPDWRSLGKTTPRAKRVLIKTHDHPEDDGPAIFLIREGGPAIHSYFQYCQDFEDDKPPLSAIIAGACPFGSWSDHYRAWQPLARPNTLFLRYEQLVGQPDIAVSALARFLGKDPVAGAVPTFEELHRTYPAFFRRGVNRDFATLWRPGHVGLFNLLHGEVMRELGYPVTDAALPGPEELREVAHAAATAYERYAKVTAEGRRPPTRSTALESARWVRLGRLLGCLPRNE